MNFPASSFADYLNNVSKIHLAMLISQVILIALSFNFPDQQNSFEEGFIIFPLFFALAIGATYYQQKQALKKAKMEVNLWEKLGAYRAVLIIRFAMIAAPFFLSIVFNFITGEKLLVVLSIGLSIYFFTLKPRRERIVKDLELTFQEEQNLDTLS